VLRRGSAPARRPKLNHSDIGDISIWWTQRAVPHAPGYTGANERRVPD